eukprot:gene7752-12222_t
MSCSFCNKVFSIATFWFGYNFAWTCLSSIILPVQIEEIVGKSSKEFYFSIINVAGSLVHIFSTPIFGYISDELNSKFGRLIWLKIFVPSSCFLFFLFSFFIDEYEYNILILMILLIFVQITTAATQGPYSGLLPQLIKKENYGFASGMQSLGLALGTLIGAIGSALFMEFLLFPTKYYVSYFYLCIGFFIPSLFTIFGLKNEELTEEDEEEEEEIIKERVKEDKINLNDLMNKPKERKSSSTTSSPIPSNIGIGNGISSGTIGSNVIKFDTIIHSNFNKSNVKNLNIFQKLILIFNELKQDDKYKLSNIILNVFHFPFKKYKKLYLIAFSSLCQFIGINLFLPFIQYYLKDFYKEPNPIVMSSLVISTLIASSGLGTIFGGILTDKFGARPIIFLSNSIIALAILIEVFEIFLNESTLFYYFLLSSLKGFGFGSTIASANVFMIENIPSKNNLAKDLSTLLQTVNLGQIIGTLLGGQILNYFKIFSIQLSYGILNSTSILFLILSNLILSQIEDHNDL